MSVPVPGAWKLLCYTCQRLHQRACARKPGRIRQAADEKAGGVVSILEVWILSQATATWVNTSRGPMGDRINASFLSFQHPTRNGGAQPPGSAMILSTCRPGGSDLFQILGHRRFIKSILLRANFLDNITVLSYLLSVRPCMLSYCLLRFLS